MPSWMLWVQIGLALYRFFKAMSDENSTEESKSQALNKGISAFDRLFPKAKVKESMSLLTPEDVDTATEIVKTVNGK